MTDAEQVRRAAGQVWRRWSAEALDVCTSIGRARALAAAGMLAGVGLYSLFWDVYESWATFLLWGMAAAALLTRSAWPVCAALAWAWLAPRLFEGRLYADDSLGVGDWLATTALLAFAIFALRLLELQTPAMSGGGARWSFTKPQAQRKPSPTVRLTPFASAAFRLVLAPAVAIVLLAVFSFDDMAFNEVRFPPSVYRAIAFFWGLAWLGILLGTAIAIARWRKLSPRQAALYARWVLLDESRREQAAIERGRARRLRNTAGD